jgi:hypothetical protein
MADKRDKRLEVYFQREQTALGRSINYLTDQWSGVTGQPPGWLLAADHQAATDRATRERPPLPLSDFRVAGPDREIDRAGVEGDFDSEAFEADARRREIQAGDDYERNQGRDPDAPWPDRDQVPFVEDPGFAFNRDYQEAIDINEELDFLGRDPVTGRQRGWDDLQDEADLLQNRDTSNDYDEAYADVAGDATLSWRLAEEDPRDIFDDVRRQARERAFPRGAVSDSPEITEGRDDEILRRYQEAISENGGRLPPLPIETDGRSANERATDLFYKLENAVPTREETLAANQIDMLARDQLAPVVSHGPDTGR